MLFLYLLPLKSMIFFFLLFFYSFILLTSILCLGWSTQNTRRWHVDSVSGVNKYAATDHFVIGAAGYGKTKFETTPTSTRFCQSGGSTSWTSSLCAELNTPFLPSPFFFSPFYLLKWYMESGISISSPNQCCCQWLPAS